MCIRDSFKGRRLNSAGNTEDGREFHRTEVVGKKESPQRTSLELPMSTQNSCADTAPLVLRGDGKGSSTRVTSSLEHLPLRYLYDRDKASTSRRKDRGSSELDSTEQFISLLAFDLTLSKSRVKPEHPPYRYESSTPYMGGWDTCIAGATEKRKKSLTV